MNMRLARAAVVATCLACLMLLAGAAYDAAYVPNDDALRGLAYMPAALAFAVAVVLTAASFHWAAALVAVVLVVLFVAGMVQGWYY